ncbi:hypothetical protein BDD12DRAFT_868316 [Trichophaea hybrida]|nr:hypothetical protein BDD12DRAFT_868316 [Trichophaea hybrida]
MAITTLIFTLSLLTFSHAQLQKAPNLVTRPAVDFKDDVTKPAFDLKNTDFSKFEVSKFPFSFGKETVDLPSLQRSVVVALPPPVTDGSDDPSKLAVSAIKTSLPLILKQFDTPPEKISDMTERGATLFSSAVTAIFNEQDLSTFSPTPSRLMPRNIFGDIADWFGDRATDIACGIFATGALPGYLVAAGLFAAQNQYSTPMTDHQDYFIAAEHGSLWRDNIRVSYRASRPVGFGNARGTSFANRIYTIDSANNVCTVPGFRWTMKLLLHETTHTAQYKSVSWSLPVFGTKYLFEYCKAGFSYSKNSMEQEAVMKAGQLGALLDDGLGLQFFQFWVARSLQSTLGMPTEKAYTSVSTPTKQIWQLGFEYGALQITPGPCYRILSYQEVDLMRRAQCPILGPCPKNSLEERDEKMLDKRMPPQGWGPPPRPRCSQAARNAANAACRKAREDWARVDAARPFMCGVSLPNVL